MPQKLKAGPQTSEISYFALFFFFYMLFRVTTLRNFDLHPMNYFFLASSAVSIALVASYLRLVTGARFAFREAALGQFVYLVLFSYAFFFRGFTGLSITIGAIATLFVAMQATGRIRWSEAFATPRHIIGPAGPLGEPPIRQ